MTDLCSECGGGWANRKHGPGDPLLGFHEFQAPRPHRVRPKELTPGGVLVCAICDRAARDDGRGHVVHARA